MTDLTLERLQQHFELRKSLLKDKEILQSLRDCVFPGGQNLTGMPRGSGVYDKVGTLAIEIVEMEELIDELQAQVAADERDIVEYIATIDDHQIRMCFRLRYLHCLSWKEVADIIGGMNTEAGVKSACYRQLENLQRDVTPCCAVMLDVAPEV